MRFNWLDRSSPLMLKLSRGAVLLALATFVNVLFTTAVLPPLGTDSLIYHLTIPAMWIRRGLFSAIDLPFHDHSAEHSPMLTQTINYVLMRVSSWVGGGSVTGGDDGLTWLVQPAFLGATFWFFYSSARLMGLDRRKAAMLLSLFILFPPFFMSAQIVNNELVMTCGSALFLYGVLRGRFRPRSGTLLAAGGIALMLATKYVAVIYALVALPVLALAFVRRFRAQTADPDERRARGRLYRDLGIAVVILLVGSASFIRNLVTFGNPVYPAEFRVAGLTLLPGLYRSSAVIDHGWSPVALWRMTVHGDGWFAIKLPVSALLWLGFAGLVAFLFTRHRRRLHWTRIAAGIAFPAASVILFFAVTPYWHVHRLIFPVYYAMWVAAAGAIALARAAASSGQRRGPDRAVRRDLGKWLDRGLLGMAGMQLLAAAIVGFSWRWAILAAAFTSFAALRPPRLCQEKWKRRRVMVGSAVAAAALIAASACYPVLRSRRNARRYGDYARQYRPQGLFWAEVERLSSHRGVTVAYSGSAIIYPLHGSRLQNRVVYVPLSPEDRPRPVELRRGEGPDVVCLRLALARRARLDERYWLEGLRREDVDLVYLVNDGARGGTAAELEIIRRHPERFRLVAAKDEVYLFLVTRRASGPGGA